MRWSAAAAAAVICSATSGGVVQSDENPGSAAPPRALACGTVAGAVDQALDLGEESALVRQRFRQCLGTHAICSVGEHSSEAAQPVIWSGERTTDMPVAETHQDGATFAYFAARSLPRSKKTGQDYCFLIRPTERTYNWDLHAWQRSPRGEVTALQTQTLQLVYPGGLVSARSLAARLWNFYAERY